MKAQVEDGCVACGACVAACPEVFRFNDDGEAEAYAEWRRNMNMRLRRPGMPARYL